jgi:hypothetical protein
MSQNQAGGNEVRPTIAEWWATFAATQAGRFWPFVFLAIAIAVFFVGTSKPTVSTSTFIAALSFMLAVIYWERLGFVRLLARRQGELRRLRAEKGTA